MRLHRAVLAALFALAPQGASADPRLDAAMKRLEGAEKKVKTLRFAFTQKTLVKVTDEEQTIRGTAAFQRPNRFRVEHVAPREQTVVSDGKTLWVYNPARRQLLADKWENWSRSAGFPRGLLPFQEGASELRKRYNIHYEGRAAGSDVVRFEPRNPGVWPYTLKVWVDDATGLPLRTELESQTLKTATHTEKLEVNPVFSVDVFTFKAPPGVETFGVPGGEGPHR